MANKQARKPSSNSHRKVNAHKCLFCWGHTTKKLPHIMEDGHCGRKDCEKVKKENKEWLEGK